MKLYHGSNIEITAVDLNRTRRGKDFGRGFYVSADYMQAVEFAENVVRREGFGVPTVSSFEFDESYFSQLSIKQFDGYTREWAEFVLANRNNNSDVTLHSYDVVIGPIADDSVGTQIRRLMQGYISFDNFLEEIKYKRTTIQYYFGTEKSLRFLKKI